MKTAIRNAPRGKDGEAIITLSQATGIVRRFAAARIPHYGEYTCKHDGQKVRVVAD